MARSRRPELEKDNPTAPQLYVGPRRRRALSRATTPSRPAARTIAAAMHTLMSAAEEFVNGVPCVQELDKERNALLEAIGAGADPAVARARGCDATGEEEAKR
ncbi:MAG: hypothetical protein IPO99_20535 [Nitrospira sp.]|nr:hypothetical protein [Nitrospira sp.]